MKALAEALVDKEEKMECDKWIRHCAPQDMYDDDGYCDNQIKKFGAYYERVVGDNSDIWCPECMALAMLQETGGEDLWQEEFARFKD